MKDIYKTFNAIDSNNLDHTFRDRIEYIYSIAVTPNVIEYIEGSKLLEINTIIDTDHWSFIVNINLEKYFQEQISYWDTIN